MSEDNILQGWRAGKTRVSLVVMTRVFALQILLFLLPFALYALWRLLTRVNPLSGAAWRPRDVLLLALAGLFLSVVLFSALSQNAGAQLFGRNEAARTLAP